VVEHPLLFDDFFHDDRRNVPLDAKEVISKFIIRFSMRFYPLVDMIIVSTCHAKLSVIPSKLHHEMEEVESIVLAWFWDMDSAEVSFTRETRIIVPLFPDLQVATPQAEALESII
jgi:hypothetical protein